MKVEIDIFKINEVIKDFLNNSHPEKRIAQGEALTFLHRYLCEQFRLQQNDLDKWSNENEDYLSEKVASEGE